MNGLYIESKKGNRYFYDDKTGIINPIPNDMWDEDSFKKKYSSIYPDSNIKGGNPAVKDIEEHLYKNANGFRQLILEVTSQCNLRCNYCIYSDHYKYTRGFENSYMDFETAKKAIDYYFENFSKIKYRNPFRNPCIGFYGGEPLLNFKLIKNVVYYIKENYPEYDEIMYYITTNGLLLSDEIQSFLVEYNFAILVSFDGNKENHDRNRVKANGDGSFDQIITNIRNFKENYKDYHKFGVSACYDTKSDLLKFEKFFDSEKLFVAKLSPVDASNTDYYNQFTQEDIEQYNENLNRLETRFYELAKENRIEKQSFLHSLIGMNYSQFAFHPVINECRPGFLPYTSACIPGEKLYITINGNIHMCEKINPNHSIGDIWNGLNFKKIVNIINNYNKNILKRCTNCNVTRFCTVCYAQCANDKCFEQTVTNCRNIENNTIEILTKYINILEERPDIYEDLTVDYYKKIFETVGERIEL